MANQILVLEDAKNDNAKTKAVVARLNAVYNEMKASNPRGYLDAWDSRCDLLATEIAMELGGGYTYRDNYDHVMVFWFPPFNERSIETWLDDHPDKWEARMERVTPEGKV